MIRFGIGGTLQPFIQGFADRQKACSSSSLGGRVATIKMSLMRCSSFSSGVFMLTTTMACGVGFSSRLISCEAARIRAFLALASR